MIQAYSKLYLEKTRTLIASMLDYAYNCLNMKIDEFYHLFLSSSFCHRVEKCDISINSGKSGIELTYLILDEKNIEYKKVNEPNIYSRSKEYWCGYYLAYFQWLTSLSFGTLNRYIDIKEILSMYSAYHEMDVTNFCEDLIKEYNDRKKETNLKIFRQMVNISQKELSIRSGVSFRTIQQYEQRAKNINKASGETLVRLANALYCSVEDLLEIDNHID